MCLGMPQICWVTLTTTIGSIGPTEMEFNVQLPSCALTKEKLKSQRLHFDTTYSNIQVNHWIKVRFRLHSNCVIQMLTSPQIVMRLSRLDENDPNKCHHFEISIDSPFNILSCRATQANTSLPVYSPGGQTTSGLDEFECGCPGATLRRRNTPPLSRQQSPLNMANQNTSTPNLNAPPGAPHRSWTSDTGGITLPTHAHVHGVNDPNQDAARPMHLVRATSFNPPPFDEAEPPHPWRCRRRTTRTWSLARRTRWPTTSRGWRTSRATATTATIARVSISR